MKKNTLIILVIVLSGLVFANKGEKVQAVYDLLKRSIGEKSKYFELELVRNEKTKNDWFEIKKTDNKIRVLSNTPVGLSRGVYYYLREKCNSIIQWSGSNVNIPEILPGINYKTESLFQFRYYFNVVTHGYTTPYWNWKRWEKEIDWMALHGINMPLIGGAYEAILFRVFKKLGLKDKDIKKFFSGPAHFPWNRMGNHTGWDGPAPDSYYKKQIALTHKILKRFKELEITPIVQAFAGFVPGEIKKYFPDEKIRELSWGGGLPEEFNAYILAPDSDLFLKIGSEYIKEWEKEFGRNNYYLSDSFNEMDVPLNKNYNKSLEELSKYGEAVYKSINSVNKDAVWVMQGWTFPFHKDKNGKLFWTPERLSSLISKVPDDKLLILDLANEYNYDFWEIDPSWKMYDAFFGKKWIYSFIPNMGGKVPLNGKLKLYASIPYEAIKYKDKGKLIGFGFAPEGIENNEIVYELLSDIPWSKEEIELDKWIKKYSEQRYGKFENGLKEAFDLLNSSIYGSFTDHPINRYQLRPYKNPEGVENHATVHGSREYKKAVEKLFEISDLYKKSKLFEMDLCEIVSQYMGLVADKKLLNYLNTGNQKEFEDAMEILETIDKLFAVNPNYNLDRWIKFSSGWGDDLSQKEYYNSNAKRILTTWGGDPVNDYAGRTWGGLISEYYAERWKAKNSDKNLNVKEWEENWILNYKTKPVIRFKNPVRKAKIIFNKYKSYLFN